MALEIFIQARHTCEGCGHETEMDYIPLGCCGKSRDPHGDALYKLDCDSRLCGDCLAADELGEKRRARPVEYTGQMGVDDDDVEPERPTVFDQRPQPRRKAA